MGPQRPRIGAIVLAAGASTRLGTPKQLIEHEGIPLVRRAAQAAHDAGADPVIVVLGDDSDRIRDALSGLEGVTTVVNHNWQSGIASSLAAGISAFAADTSCDAALVTLSDQPLVNAAMLERLIEQFAPGRSIIASSYDGVLGVPAVFGREHFEELVSLTGDKGAGQWIRARAGEVTSIPLNSASLDVDTASDVERLRGSSAEGQQR